jgi:hypothetical protein
VKTVFKRTKDQSQEVGWVLKGVTSNNISGSAARRVHSKCPTLAYFNEKQNIAILRASMPFQDPQQAKRCLFDEFYLSALANRTNKKQSQKLYIFNPFTEKLAQDKNMHFENTSGYPGCKIVFYGIHDMEAIAKSYQMICKYSNKYHRSK